MRVEIDREEIPQGEPPFVFGKVPGWGIAVGCLVSLILPIIGFFVIPFVIYDYFRLKKAEKKWHTVGIRVEFTEEEKHIIESNDLIDRVFLERPLDDLKSTNKTDQRWYSETPEMYWLSIRNIMDGSSDIYHCSIPAEARGYEAELEAALPKLKGFLDANVRQEEDNGKKILEF